MRILSPSNSRCIYQHQAGGAMLSEDLVNISQLFLFSAITTVS